MYESDITQFLKELKKSDPSIEDGQREGRAILWDRPQDLEFSRQTRDSRVPPSAYSYYPLPD